MSSQVSQTSQVEAAVDALFGASALLDPIRLRVWDSEKLTVTQLRLLNHLYEDEGMSNADLADRLYVTRPSVSALLERLERGGFIRREVSPTDRRGIRIWLEPRGREAVASLRSECRDFAASLMDDLSPADLDQFIAVVTRFTEAGRARRARDLKAEAEA